ncbi:PREDICTED: RNA-dependent RNA polymerase 1 [Tarenaya hassleriana]|uniref:RNA-dependent RNA polymerase 1 n=1 Tax=Tarenaya hassleriana TaxID=28532 RepID=UPI00053C4573|nr:PREDICTED: RNA-dependent RNA polymerase 1 [Tarenaya hassleriana]
MGKTIQVYGFPSDVTAAEVKNFLEQRTGLGTVFAIKVRQPKNGGARSYAIVQFTATRWAELIISLADERLWYGRSYLKAREMSQDIVPKPRVLSHNISDLRMHFGCQVSTDKFSVLWRAENVHLAFGTGMRKLHFTISCCNADYKLELPYENIWQIDLHSPKGESSKYLVIQVIGAPRIFEKDNEESVTILFGLRDFYRDGTDEEWIRRTDFTPSCYVGQSSAFCVELPDWLVLPNFRENFANYKEHKGSTFVLETGSSYSSNRNELVPVVDPPPGADLPFEILFKVNILVQNACLSGPTLDIRFYELLDQDKFDRALIDHALSKLFHLRECCYEPARWLAEEYRKWVARGRLPQSPAISLDNGLVYVHRVQVTPSRVYFCGPEVNVSNRVLRHYSEYTSDFLRISFVDEELEKIHSTVLSPRSSRRRTHIYYRILSVLRHGIVIGDKKFEFLAFSSSQLRENSAWMFASRDGLTAADIRRWMGDFSSIKNVAKYAARLGQSFGSSRETLSVSKDETETIPDIEITVSGKHYVFSDGIGKISSAFADLVAKKCGLTDFTPSAFQIRYGGYKGVVAVDPKSSKKMSLRTTMSKFESENTKLDVLAWSKYQPCYLNRQLITLLSTLGVKDCVFEKKQRESVDQLDEILTDGLRAREALDLMAQGENTNVLKEMLSCGYRPDTEPFLSMMLQNFRALKLLELRTKTRIFVPHGRSMMGCLDETGILEYGQVFVQFSDPLNPWKLFPVHGEVVVAKNPCLHPGDVRVLKAVRVPELYHMVDCVVFPQKGPRPHPNECSGSDLDGDIYFVCWDSELIPPRTSEPMDYTPEPAQILDHDVTIEEVEEYFTNYIVNDSLGIIANAHTAFADKEPAKAFSSQCIELAHKFSIAVDFPKTGVAAEIPPHLHVKEYPDFMEKPDKPTYESMNVIGKLFREVKERAPPTIAIRSFTLEVARRSYDSDMEVNGFEYYIKDAIYYKSSYDNKLGNLMDYYGIQTEAEILSGSIMRMSKSFTRKRDADSIRMAVRALRKEARSWFNTSGDGYEVVDEEMAKASAWYHVTYHPDYWGWCNDGLKRDHFLSFAWCVYDKLVLIKKQTIRRREDMVARHLNRSLHL